MKVNELLNEESGLTSKINQAITDLNYTITRSLRDEVQRLVVNGGIRQMSKKEFDAALEEPGVNKKAMLVAKKVIGLDEPKA